jgi:signal transduction histidine kinase
MHDRLQPRARWVDAGLIALAALLGSLFFLDSLKTAGERATGFPTADLVVGALACLALLVRRRWPVTLAAVLIPSMALSASAMGATAVAIGAVAVYRPGRVTAVVMAAHATTVVTLFALVATSTHDFSQGAAVLLTLDAAMVASGLLVRSQRRLVASLRERAREAEERHRLQVEEARHAERERIAREMHDVLAHRISLLAVHAGALEVRRSAPEAERRAAGVVREYAYEALEDLRMVIGMLRDDVAADPDRPQPTLTDLPALIEQSRLAGTSVALDSQLGDLTAPPAGVARHVYRVVQEGLTNARKHAPGEPVRVRLTVGDGLVVEITNPVPATATAPLPGGGSGLFGLRERMDLVGGQLEHGRTADGEFRLHARVPWRP